MKYVTSYLNEDSIQFKRNYGLNFRGSFIAISSTVVLSRCLTEKTLTKQDIHTFDETDNNDDMKAVTGTDGLNMNHHSTFSETR